VHGSLVSEKGAAVKHAEVEDTVGVQSWSEPVTPVFESKFVFEANIQKSGERFALWHNPVTGEYDLRPVLIGDQ
jgi:hypothetical protein